MLRHFTGKHDLALFTEMLLQARESFQYAMRRFIKCHGALGDGNLAETGFSPLLVRQESQESEARAWDSGDRKRGGQGRRSRDSFYLDGSGSDL